MLERYRDVMNQIHMPDDCDWKIRSAMEKKARETHRRPYCGGFPWRQRWWQFWLPLHWLLRFFAVTDLPGNAGPGRQSNGKTRFRRESWQSLPWTISGCRWSKACLPQTAPTWFWKSRLWMRRGQARLADVDLLYDLSAFNRDHPDPLPDGGAISWDHWVLPDGTETCKRIGISVFTVNRPFVQGESFPLYLAMQDRPIPPDQGRHYPAHRSFRAAS